MLNRPFRNLSRLQSAALTATGVGMLALPFIAGMINAPLLRAQSASRFESTSVRKCPDIPGNMKGRGYSAAGGVLNTGCMPLADEQGLGLIQRAYVRFNGAGSTWPTILPVKGRPSWFDSHQFEIVGKAAPGTPQDIMEGPMLRAALEDRFRLRLHEETAGVPVYELIAGVGSLQLTAFNQNSCIAMPNAVPPPKLPDGQRYCNVRVGSQPPSILAEGVDLDEFSKLLSLVLDRPVTNKTGIEGKFAIKLDFSPDASTPRFLGGDLARFATAPSPDARPIAQAIAALGLRLQPNAGSQRFLVIDHIEKPPSE